MMGLRSNLWMIRRFGVYQWWRYRNGCRVRLVIDYAEVFTPDELALIAERIVPAPWEAR